MFTLSKAEGLNAPRQAGLTLIEVLISLFILVFGVLVVLKIFPLGFSTIDAGRQRSFAASLANAELERWKLLADSLPEAIVATRYNGTMIYDYDATSVEPRELRISDDNDPRNPDLVQPLWQPDSLWLPRTVLGERAIISSSTYSLSLGPLDYFYRYVPPSPGTTIAQVAQVYEPEPFTRVAALTGDLQYTVDYSTGTFAFNVASYAGQPFAVTYDWVEQVSLTEQAVRRVVGEPMVLDGIASPQAVRAAAETNFVRLIPQSERVYHCYTEWSSLPVPAPGGQSHYYYVDKVVDLNTGDFRFYPGVLRFNAADAGREARINYRVADWAVLRRVATVPVTLQGAVSLPMAPVKSPYSQKLGLPGYKNPPRQPQTQPLALRVKSPVTDLLGDGSDDAQNAFLIAVPLQGGTPLYDEPDTTASLTALLAATDADRRSRFFVNYRTGRMRFNWDVNGDGDLADAEDINRSGQTYRIYYRAAGDWAVQLTTPTQTYLPTFPPNPTLTNQFFYWDNRGLQTGETSEEYDARLRTLFFAPTLANRTVRVRYADVSNDSSRFHNAESHRLSDRMQASAVPGVRCALQSGGVGGALLDTDEVAYLRLEALPDAASYPTAFGPEVRARVVWAGRGGSIVLPDRTQSGRREFLTEAWRQAWTTTFLTTPAK